MNTKQQLREALEAKQAEAEAFAKQIEGNFLSFVYFKIIFLQSCYEFIIHRFMDEIIITYHSVLVVINHAI